jgi:hypothetical protein
MPTELVIAFVAAVPPTIAATAAWRRSRKLEQPLEEVNAAVNHRQPGQPTLVQTVDQIAKNMVELHECIEDVRRDLHQHQAWHQQEKEQ